MDAFPIELMGTWSDNKRIGISAEHYIIYQLKRNGLAASHVGGNEPICDILVHNPDSLEDNKTIEVKCRSNAKQKLYTEDDKKSSKGFLINNPKYDDKRLIYAFVDYKGQASELSIPDVWYIPSLELSKLVKDYPSKNNNSRVVVTYRKLNSKKTRENEIDDMIVKKDDIQDNINIEVKEEKYNNESYNLFRLEISLYLEQDKEVKDQLIKIVRNKEMKKDEKKIQVRNILFRNVSKAIKKFKKNKNNDFINVIDKLPDLTNYSVKNVRDYCKSNKSKDKCNLNLHCLWVSDSCKLQLRYNKLIEFINKITEEIIQNNIQFKELIQENNYFVSDIVDYNLFTTRSEQKILKTSNFTIKKIMSELFGKDKVPKIGKKRISKKEELNIEEDYPELIQIGNLMKQPIIKNQDSVIRAYANCLYWINNRLYDIESRNLGYISDLQTQITYLLKAKIIDFILSNKDDKKFKNSLGNFFENKEDFFESAINKFRKTTINTDGFIELLILSYIFPKYPILVFDNFQEIKYIFNSGNNSVTKDNVNKYINKEDVIRIQFDYENMNEIPSNIYSIYLFD